MKLKWNDPNFWDDWYDLTTAQQDELCEEYQRGCLANIKYTNFTADEIKQHKSLSAKLIKNGNSNLSEKERNLLYKLNNGYTKHYQDTQREKLRLRLLENKKRLERNRKARERYEKKRKEDLELLYKYGSDFDICDYQWRTIHEKRYPNPAYYLTPSLREQIKNGTATINEEWLNAEYVKENANK